MAKPYSVELRERVLRKLLLKAQTFRDAFEGAILSM